MTDAIQRAVVDAFYQAYRSRDPDRIGMFLDDEVEWLTTGPTAVMAFCGKWQGKPAVLERFSSVTPRLIMFKNLDIESLLVDGDRSAMFGRITSVHRHSGRLICHRSAHIAQYRAGKILHYRVINDSLDAAEQFVGHRIDLNFDPDEGAGDLIAV